MKQKPTSKEKFTVEIKKVLERVKPVQEKIEKALADSPTFQKWVKNSAPWRKKIAASVTAQLEKAKAATDIAKKEIKDLKAQYKTEPKKAFTNTVTKARSMVKGSWKKERHNKKPTLVTKPSSGHGTKTEKRESVTD